MLESLTTFVGGGGPRFWFSVAPEMQQLNYAQIIIQVKDKHYTNHLIGPLQKAFSAVPGARVDARQLETGKAVGLPVAIRISGEDIPTLRAYAEQVKEIFRAIPIARGTRDDWGTESFTVKLRTDPDRANLAGVTNLDVAASSAVGMNGFQVTELREEDNLKISGTFLFDLGGTLVEYFERSEFPAILRQAIEEARSYLVQEGYPSIEVLWQKVAEEDHEAPDSRIRPLEERLARVFRLEDATGSLMDGICRAFMKPIFARSRLFEDTLQTLQKMKTKGFRTAIVSNTTWGSPAHLWRKEIERYGLPEFFDTVVFCRDAGWRKPASQIFEYTLEKMQAPLEDCLFIGDDPRWDVAGPRAIGMDAVLIDRKGVLQNTGEQPIRNLHELWSRL